jgi:hypothetical protein
MSVHTDWTPGSFIICQETRNDNNAEKQIAVA